MSPKLVFIFAWLFSVAFVSVVSVDDELVKSFSRKRIPLNTSYHSIGPSGFLDILYEVPLSSEDFLLFNDFSGYYVYNRTNLELLRYIAGLAQLFQHVRLSRSSGQ
jgi:hypothetical protein